MHRVKAYFRGWLQPAPAGSVVAPIIGHWVFRRLRAAASWRVAANKAVLPVGFADDDLVAIYLYTHQKLRTYHYKSINAVLRGDSHPRAVELLVLAGVLAKALSKLPASPGVLTRGTWLDTHVLAQHVVGRVVTYAAFTSASQNGIPPLDGSVFFQIKGKTGRSIAAISRFPAEREVLFLPGARFLVLHRAHHSGKTHVVMEEM